MQTDEIKKKKGKRGRKACRQEVMVEGNKGRGHRQTKTWRGRRKRLWTDEEKMERTVEKVVDRRKRWRGGKKSGTAWRRRRKRL